MKVVIWLENAVRAFDLNRSQLEVLKACYPQHELEVARDEHTFLELLPDADAVLVWRFAADWYGLARKLQWVATPSAGRELVHRDPAQRVSVSYGSFQGKIMAESLLSMMLFHSRRLDLCVDQQQSRRWERDVFSSTRRLAGQRALILGYGPLGRQCGHLLKAVGLEVFGMKRSPERDAAPADAVYPVSDLQRLLPTMNHVVLTLPGGAGTQHLMNDGTLGLLPPGACLYNLGRGNAVDSAALVRALDAGRVARAFLDVFEEEPLPAGSPLWSTPNLHIMPHASAICAEYLDLWLEELSPRLR